MTTKEKLFLRQKVLCRAIRHNHSIDSDSFKITLRGISPDDELKKYLFPIERMAKHNLPLRFGMYKPSKSMEKVSEEIELEDLDVLPQRREIDPNHKVRKIFS